MSSSKPRKSRNLLPRRLACASLAAALLVGGCVPKEDEASEDEAYRAALPEAAAVSLDVPNSDGSTALALGDPSGLYQITRGVSVSVNAHVGVLLAALKIVSVFPPTTRGEDFRVWGPSEPKGLEAVAWRLTVTKIDDDNFTLALDGRKKGETAEDAFKTVISGDISKNALEGLDRGELFLDYDASNELNDPCRTGGIRVRWAKSEGVRTVEVDWENFVNTCQDENFEDVTYHYSENEDFSGEFEFRTINNIHDGDPERPEKETLTMKSRWSKDGAGRSDMILSGSEIEADLASVGISDTEVKASQCWSDLFVLTFADTAPDELEPYLFPALGQTSDCPFEEANYPAL